MREALGRCTPHCIAHKQDRRCNPGYDGVLNEDLDDAIATRHASGYVRLVSGHVEDELRGHRPVAQEAEGALESVGAVRARVGPAAAARGAVAFVVGAEGAIGRQIWAGPHVERILRLPKISDLDRQAGSRVAGREAFGADTARFASRAVGERCVGVIFSVTSALVGARRVRNAVRGGEL